MLPPKFVEDIKEYILRSISLFFPKIALFKGKCWKIWYNQAGHRWKYNAAQKSAICVPDNQGKNTDTLT